MGEFQLKRIGLAFLVSVVGAVIILGISSRADHTNVATNPNTFNLGIVMLAIIVNSIIFFPSILRTERPLIPRIGRYLVSYLMILLVIALAQIGLGFLLENAPLDEAPIADYVKNSAVPALVTIFSLILIGQLFRRID